MRKHLNYFWYLLRHKYYVFKAACKLNIPLRGIFHDISKFLPNEWFPYAEHFYGKFAREWRDKTGYYKPSDTGDPAFDYAVFLHLRRNDHHHQWWILSVDGPSFQIYPMSNSACREMLADWIGASKAQGKSSVKEWYKKNKRRMLIHPDTRKWIEDMLEKI